MIPPDDVIREEDLHAYLDGELPSQREALLVAAYLQARPDEARRLDAYRADGEAMRRVFSAVHELPPVAQWTPEARPRAARRTWHLGFAVAASLLVGALGFIAGERVMRDPAMSEHAELLDEVTGYHRVYARETTHLVEVPAAQKDELVGWLSDRIGRKLVVPDLSAERLQFVGGRMLVANGRPLAQLLYSRPGEPPVAVCITRTSEAPLRLAVEERAGLRLASWNEGGYAYVVVGTMTADRMRRLADRVSASYTPKPEARYGAASGDLACYPA